MSATPRFGGNIVVAMVSGWRVGRRAELERKPHLRTKMQAERVRSRGSARKRILVIRLGYGRLLVLSSTCNALPCSHVHVDPHIHPVVQLENCFHSVASAWVFPLFSSRMCEAVAHAGVYTSSLAEFDAAASALVRTFCIARHT